MKKLLAVTLSALLCLAIFPVGVFAEVGEFTIPDGEGVSLVKNNEDNYEVVAENPNYYPAIFSLRVEGITSLDWSSLNGAYIVQYDGSDWYTVYLQDSEDVLTVNGKTIQTHLPNGGSASGEGIYAVLPAPGQFTNTSMKTGGWGSIYTGDGTNITGTKDFVDNVATTGISLGYFGGYVVLDYSDNPIQNSVDNAYGVDFIVYGNAFMGNSEPGMIQVSQDASTWYDIAGSLYYEDGVTKGYSLTYTNPAPVSEGGDTYSFGDAPNHATNITGVPYVGSSEGEVKYNPWHQQKFFPLKHNYFYETDYLSNPTKQNLLNFVDYHFDPNGSTLTLKGTHMNIHEMFGAGNYTKTENYTFGYCDVHPNGSTSSEQYNPYTATKNSTNGDPIDISWAVDSDGNPVQLDSIRYIRIYNPVAQDNPPFGEVSVEVSGTKRATKVNTSGEEEIPAVRFDQEGARTRMVWLHDLQSYNVPVKNKPINMRVYGEDSSTIFVNNHRLSSGETLTIEPRNQTVRIIVQTGDKDPNISVIHINVE